MQASYAQLLDSDFHGLVLIELEVKPAQHHGQRDRGLKCLEFVGHALASAHPDGQIRCIGSRLCGRNRSREGFLTLA